MSSPPVFERGRKLLGEQPLGKRDAGILMVLPGLALFGAFMLYPIAHLVWISLTDATHAGTVLGEGA
jgi:arabinogalactan oligomer/maltooligosaccharide transport system permease protein